MKIVRKCKPQTVIVTGGRDYSSAGALYATLDALHKRRPITLLVHGGASGADKMAAEWANHRDVNSLEFSADWNGHGRAAGPLRNQRMVDRGADLVVAFPGGRGTADCVRRARAAGIEVLEVKP